MSKNEIWTYFNRMQKDCMAKDSIITRGEFFAESESEQKDYYNWMRKQVVNPFNIGPCWN